MTRPRSSRARFWLQIAISVVIFTALLSLVDVSGVRQALAKLDWRMGPWLVLVAAALILAFSLRWYLFLGRRVGFTGALFATTVGLGGNMVIPARGGDVLRVVLSVRQGGISAHAAISSLMLEKAIDLIFVATIGLLGIALHAAEVGNPAALTTASLTALAVVGVALAGLWIARRGKLISVVKRAFRVMRIGPSIYRHAYRVLDRLASALQAQAVILPAVVSSLLWCGLYPLSYILIARMVGIPIGYFESLILVFVGALGLGLPAAPSGLGTFHASILSGFMLLGRDSTEGFVVAVAIHATFFVVLLVPGAMAYFAMLMSRGWKESRGTFR
jgi:uncharacterized protein (TIRG00374 family)